jgi:hypothetical protein
LVVHNSSQREIAVNTHTSGKIGAQNIARRYVFMIIAFRLARSNSSPYISRFAYCYVSVQCSPRPISNLRFTFKYR